LQLRPNTGLWMLGMGVSLDALGRGDEAKSVYREAIRSGSLSADLSAFAEQRLR
jgi:MSHA biogenesis protein MshN